MSLESILTHIREQAQDEAQKIILKAKLDAAKMIEAGKLEAEKLYQQALEKERALCEKQKQKLLVGARLKARQAILSFKQETIARAFASVKSEAAGGKFKKFSVLPQKTEEVPEDGEFYFKNLQHDYETEIAEILFG